MPKPSKCNTCHDWGVLSLTFDMCSQLMPEAVCMSGMPCSNRCEGTCHLTQTPFSISLQTLVLRCADHNTFCLKWCGIPLHNLQLNSRAVGTLTEELQGSGCWAKKKSRCSLYTKRERERKEEVRRMHRTAGEWEKETRALLYAFHYLPSPSTWSSLSIQSSPSQQQLSLLSDRWAVKPDYWTNGLRCSTLSFLKFFFSRPSQVKLFQVFRREHAFLNSWESSLRGGVINMALTLSGKKSV